MIVRKTLRELANEYTVLQIVQEFNRRFIMYGAAMSSFLELIQKIQNAPAEISNDKEFIYFVIETREYIDLFAGLSIDGKRHRLTYKNTRDINDLAATTVVIDKSDTENFYVFTDPSNELEMLVITLLSIHAFSSTIIDEFFDGDKKYAHPGKFIFMLHEDWKSARPMLKQLLRHHAENEDDNEKEG